VRRPGFGSAVVMSAASATTELLVALNCVSTAASATSPGYSAASPEAKAIKATAAWPSG
jgi:hypothetical protein